MQPLTEISLSDRDDRPLTRHGPPASNTSQVVNALYTSGSEGAPASSAVITPPRLRRYLSIPSSPPATTATNIALTCQSESATPASSTTVTSSATTDTSTGSTSAVSRAEEDSVALHFPPPGLTRAYPPQGCYVVAPIGTRLHPYVLPPRPGNLWRTILEGALGSPRTFKQVDLVFRDVAETRPERSSGAGNSLLGQDDSGLDVHYPASLIRVNALDEEPGLSPTLGPPPPLRFALSINDHDQRHRTDYPPYAMHPTPANPFVWNLMAPVGQEIRMGLRLSASHGEVAMYGEVFKIYRLHWDCTSFYVNGMVRAYGHDYRANNIIIRMPSHAASVTFRQWRFHNLSKLTAAEGP
ncbi:hypothetical protein PUNSTDRAFT_137487 [Punctularia strigosozonata HHB-11173 SS5]|uniref:uncharacterized protein n=1 Tax=Punctularia strigosozonata (strain HHB-11173) TaxID=741275 RepID=UPI00044173DC|nr:uncharacterized protein PUNSTDRAFT_137487 [Punctularia strigosozonata HHB-11173 SS5]EIN05372.1 hypothetical protein PUNSTDRAFT_137487 [Punctularia strigosozonata HHB-11173 SS5]